LTKEQELRDQAARAERLASSILDTVTVERLLAFAADCRKQIGVLSEPKKAQKLIAAMNCETRRR
jgi:hypothetical protein